MADFFLSPSLSLYGIYYLFLSTSSTVHLNISFALFKAKARESV